MSFDQLVMHLEVSGKNLFSHVNQSIELWLSMNETFCKDFYQVFIIPLQIYS